MGVYAQRIFSRLPRTSVLLERWHFRGCLKLSCYQSVNRAYVFLSSASNTKYLSGSLCFRFPFAASDLTASSPLVCNSASLKTNHGLIVCQRSNSTDKQSKATSNDKKSLVQARESPYAHLTVGQKVKEAGKDASYIVVIIVGIAVTGLMFYMIGSELLSSQSPSGVYGDALKKCQDDTQVIAALGEPIKGYGETSRRGRRRHLSHTEFEVRGIPHMRMRFYIEGPYKKATVHVEVQKNDSGKYAYRYLVVETEGYPHRTFVLEDNR